MAITLTPEQEQQIRYIAELRGSASGEAVLADLLSTTYERELYFAENLEDINVAIEEAWQEMEREEMLTPEEAKAQRDAYKHEFLARRSAA